MPKQSGTADLIVKAAIALITAAAFVGAYLQFQMSFWSALLAGLSIYVMLLLGHAVMRRSEREKDLVYEVNRLEDEVARLKVTPQASTFPTQGRMPKLATRPPAGPTPGAPVATPVAGPPPIASPLPAKAARTLRAEAEAIPEREPRLMSPRAPDMPSEAPRSEPSLGRSNPAAGNLSLRADPVQADIPHVPTLPDWSAPLAAPASSGERKMHDYWPAAPKPTLPEGPRAELPPLQAERETDLDAVHGMIKRLADEVSVGEPTLEGMPPQRQESVLRASLNALQTTANVMRSSKKRGGIAQGAAGKAGPTPPPIMPSHARLASLAEAVSAGRIDVKLSPIVGLADHQVHYYEVVACPRDERGALLSTNTRDPQLAVAGLLPLLDSARLRQAAQVARSLAEEGNESNLFSPATAVSLANDTFLDELADAYRDREAVASELILTFAQADVRTFGSSEWSALTDMRDLGFRFGIEDVTDFDYEFTALGAAGFSFVKVDAATLLAGLASSSGPMPAADVCRNLSELGLTLIVCNIDDEAKRDVVLAAGVPLGQGALFGEPMSSGLDTFAASGDAAA
ncbi:MAG: EAL domain-containing protein [Hyphomicrobium sp.]